MAVNWRIYGSDTVACKLSQAELPSFFQKALVVGLHEAALIVKNGRVKEVVTQDKVTVVGFWDRLKSLFGVDQGVEIFLVDTSPHDIIIYLGVTGKGARSEATKSIGPGETDAGLRQRTGAGARAAGTEAIGPAYTEIPLSVSSEMLEVQRDVSGVAVVALSADHEVISAECRLRVSIFPDDIMLLAGAFKGRAALAVWDLAALIRDELLAKVLLPRIGKLSSSEIRGNNALVSSIQEDVSRELRRTLNLWGLRLESFIINWGLTDLERIELDRKAQTREEEALKFAHERHLADMHRQLAVELARMDNLRQLKLADAKGDEDLKALYATGEVERARILEGRRLNIAQIDAQIASLQLDIRKREEEITFEFEKRRKELDADLDRREWQDLSAMFEKLQQAKRERQKQEQDFMTQQMNIQTSSIERLVSQGLDKGAVDGATIQEIAKQFSTQRALDRSDAKVDAFSRSEAAKADLKTYKDAEDRERKHQIDMTAQSSKMMDAAKQNVPHTVVQGEGITPAAHVIVSASGEQVSQAECTKCGTPVQPGWKTCPMCEEELAQAVLRCSCGAAIESGWKVCPFCRKRLKP